MGRHSLRRCGRQRPSRGIRRQDLSCSRRVHRQSLCRRGCRRGCGCHRRLKHHIHSIVAPCIGSRRESGRGRIAINRVAAVRPVRQRRQRRSANGRAEIVVGMSSIWPWLTSRFAFGAGAGWLRGDGSDPSDAPRSTDYAYAPPSAGECLDWRRPRNAVPAPRMTPATAWTDSPPTIAMRH
jgi:hypothetical protein